MKTFCDAQSFFEYGPASVMTESPDGNINSGFVYQQLLPPGILNWFFNRLTLNQLKMARRAVGTHVLEVSQLASEIKSIKWVDMLKLWVAIPNYASDYLRYSPDGQHWYQGTAFDFGADLPTNIDYFQSSPTQIALFAASDAAGAIEIQRTLDVTTGTAVTPPWDTLSLPGPAHVFSRNVENAAQNQLIVTTGSTASPIIVSPSFDADFTAVTGLSSGVFRGRLTHYIDSIDNDLWFGVSYSGTFGFLLQRFSDTTMASGTELYDFDTEEPNFVPTCIDINSNAGRLIVAGTESDTDDLLRIMYSDDFGATWADAAVPTVDFGSAASTLTQERIQYLGGSFWVAHFRPTTAAAVPQSIFYSVDNGVTWYRSQLLFSASDEQQLAFADFDFSGNYWLTARGSSGAFQHKGSVLP